VLSSCFSGSPEPDEPAHFTHPGSLGRTDDAGAAIARALFALLLGITQSMKTPHVDDLAVIPPDARHLLGADDTQEAFVRIGRWLIDGSHHDTTVRG
jgi:hypothetical protein